ncbi:MAG: hypothetical protein M3273_06915, partial [Actinomycetota bacterium]|nr:hypothetical protein [Actinomycetota bacterium]
TDAPYEATMTTRPVRDGAVALDVVVEPPSAVEETDMFEVMSWQGGELVVTPLREIGPGSYRAVDPVPVEGDWKSMVRISDKDVMVAVPVFMPEDREIGAGEIPVVPRRTAEFRRDTELLMREAHGGPAWPAMVAYGSILTVALVWIAALTVGFVRVGSRRRRRETRGLSPRGRAVPT